MLALSGYKVLKTLTSSFFLLCWISLFFPLEAFSAPPLENRTVILEEGKTSYPVTPYFDLLEDREKQWTIEEISSSEFTNKFVPNLKETVNLGHTTSA